MTTVDRRAPLVGRDELLADLATFSAVDDPEGSASVLIGGDAGVGKTRLLLALRDRAVAAGRLVVVGHSLDFGDSALPYLPFSEILGRLQDELPAVVDTVAQTYPAIIRLLPRQRVRVAQAARRAAPSAAEHASGADDRSSRSDLFAGIHALLEEAARTQPLLVVVEDVHWADQSSRELLSYLFARQLEAPVSLVVSYRSDDVHRRHPLRPTLAEWSRLPDPATASRSVRCPRRRSGPWSTPCTPTRSPTSRSGRSSPGPTATRSSSRSSAAMEGLSSATTLPVDLADLLLVRLDRLDEPSRRVVGAASVAGRRVSHELLTRVLAASGSDAQDLDLGLRQAVDALILEPRQAGNRRGMRSATPCSPRRSTTTSCPASAPACTPPTSPPCRTAASPAPPRSWPCTRGPPTTSRPPSPRAPRPATRRCASGRPRRPPSTTSPRSRCSVPRGRRRGRSGRERADALVDAGDAYRAVKLVSAHLAMLPDTAPVESRARLLLAKAESAFTTEVDFDPLDLTTEALALIPEEPPSKLRARALMIHAQAQRWHHNTEAAAASASEAVQMATELGYPGLARAASLVLAKVADLSGAAGRRHRAAAEGSRRGGRRRRRRDPGPAPAGHRALRHREVRRRPAPLPRGPGAVPRPVGGPGPRGASTPGPSPALAAYILGDWDGVLSITDTSGEAPPPLAEAYLRSVSLDVEAGRGMAEVLDHIAAIRPFWERDGAMVLYCTTAAIDLYGDRASSRRPVTSTTTPSPRSHRLWPGSIMWLRLRLSAAPRRPDRVPRLHALPVGAGRVGGPRRTPRRRAAATSRPPSPWRVRPGSRPAPGTSAARRRSCGCGGWPTSTRRPRTSWSTAWRASVAAFEEMGHAFEIARSQARLAAALHAAGEPTEARRLVTAARETARRLGPSRCSPSCARWPAPGRGREEHTADVGRPHRP